jgi:PEP-CTERM motif
MRTLLRTSCLAVLSLLIFGPTSARAEPITISSGTITGHVLLSAAQFDIQGSGFSFNGSLEGFLGNACTPCLSPVADLSARLDQFSTGAGTGVIEGVTYSPFVYVGFSSGTFTTPTATLTELGSTLVEVPFTFAGVMNGYLEHPLIRPSDALPIFTVNLGGSGRASAEFFGLLDDNGARVYSVSPPFIRYEFTRTEPVPEPGTLLLVGGALAGLTLARVRSRRGRRDDRSA